MNRGTGGSYMVGYRVRQSLFAKGQFGNIRKFFKSLQNIGFSSMLATEGDKKNSFMNRPKWLNVCYRVPWVMPVNIHEKAIFV